MMFLLHRRHSFLPRAPIMPARCLQGKIKSPGHWDHRAAHPPPGHRTQAAGATASSVIMPVARCGMWWQWSIQRAASPASSATVTIAIGGT